MVCCTVGLRIELVVKLRQARSSLVCRLPHNTLRLAEGAAISRRQNGQVVLATAPTGLQYSQRLCMQVMHPSCHSGLPAAWPCRHQSLLTCSHEMMPRMSSIWGCHIYFFPIPI